MFSDGTVTLGTGNDDLREGSQVWVRIHLRDRPPVVFEAALGARWVDRTSTGPIPWRLRSWHTPPVGIEDVERVEVSFVPDSRDFMEDDEWWFTQLTVEVNDTAAGAVTLYENASVDHKFDRAGTWSSGILPGFTAVGRTLLRVFDDVGRPVPGADVFISSHRFGHTDESGQLLVPDTVLGIFPAATDIVVRKRVHQQPYYRSNHDFDATENWNYRVHLTNVAIVSSGVATPQWGPFGSVVDVVVSRDNTLIGLNVLVAVEWDLAATDLTDLEAAINDCSEFLYNATDGQFFIEIAQITDQRDLWDDSDYRVFVDWDYRANVPNVRGGFLGQNILGSAMKMSRRNPGDTYAHEFGHFGLALGDEYRDEDATACTAGVAMPGSLFGGDRPRASCMMWRQSDAPKICSTHAANPHVSGTRQGDEACWDTIIRRYDVDRRWNLRTPVDRRAIPGTLRYRDGRPVRSGFMMPVIHRRLGPDRFGLLGELVLTVQELGGAPITGVVVKSREPGGAWMTQGSTDLSGNRLLAGIHVGDRIRLEPGSGFAFESDVPSGVGGTFTLRIGS